MTKDIYLRSVHKHAPRKLVLAASGTPWYSAVSKTAIIIDDQEQLIIRMRDPLTNFEQTEVLQLDDLPERPPKTTKLLIETSFQSETSCRIRITDIGFGEIFLRQQAKYGRNSLISLKRQQSLCKRGRSRSLKQRCRWKFSVRHEDVRNTHLFTGGIMLVSLKERLCYDIRSFR